jgi:SAM-dependent methyltransferase
MSSDASPTLTDRGYLTGTQYRTDANLAARQSIYAYQEPHIDLVATVLDLAALTGAETVADVGCGNGIYLAGLARRGHRGPILGVDLSPGVLATARTAAPGAGLTVGDAAALPVADGAADVTLAPHMLYHVPDRAAAAAEFRRITRPGGQLLVVLNGSDHLAELRELVNAAAAAEGSDGWWGLRAADLGAEYGGPIGMTLDAGAELLAGTFGSVRRHDFRAELFVPSLEPLLGYIASMRAIQATHDPAAFTAAVAERVRFGPDGTFRIRTHSGLLICR